MLCLENDSIKAKILPGDGGRLVSLIDKTNGREYIWTNHRTEKLTRTHGANYDNLSAGGIEEAFPTGYPDVFEGDELPFFGEIWPIAWEYSPSKKPGGGWLLWTYCSIYPVKVSKEWYFDEGALVCEYRLTNLSGKRLPYLFGVHPSLGICPGDTLELPQGMYRAGAMYPSHLIPEKEFAWPLAGARDLGVAPGADSCEFVQVYTPKTEKGQIVLHTDENRSLHIDYDAAYFKSLSVWMIYGGWRGHRCLMCEFFTGWPLKLSEAHARGECAYLEPRGNAETAVKYGLK